MPMWLTGSTRCAVWPGSRVSLRGVRRVLQLENTSLLGAVRDGRMVRPRDLDRLEPGDSVMVLAPPTQAAILDELFAERPASDEVELGFAFSQGAVTAAASYEETAGGAYVAALDQGALADRLGGRDREVAVSVDGEPQGTLSLDGSTRAVRAALETCRGG